jgi:hypothetical protein
MFHVPPLFLGLKLSCGPPHAGPFDLIWWTLRFASRRFFGFARPLAARLYPSGDPMFSCGFAPNLADSIARWRGTCSLFGFGWQPHKRTAPSLRFD